MRCETEFMAATATGRFPEKCVLESRHQGAHVSEIGHVDPDADLDRCRKLLAQCAYRIELNSTTLHHIGEHDSDWKTCTGTICKEDRALICEADAAARGEK